MSSSGKGDLYYVDADGDERKFNASNNELIISFKPSSGSTEFFASLKPTQDSGQKPPLTAELVEDLEGFAKVSLYKGTKEPEAFQSLSSNGVQVTTSIPAMIEIKKYGPLVRYFLPESFTLRLKDSATDRLAEAEASNTVFGLKILRRYDKIGQEVVERNRGFYTVSLPQAMNGVSPESNLFNTLREMNDQLDVKYAEPDEVAFNYLRVPPNDPNYANNQWGLNDTQYPDDDINATNAWNITQGYANVIIAVVDTGIRTDHQDLAGKIVDSAYYVGTSVGDSNGHGTWVSGAAGAATNNSLGIAGAGFHCRIMPVRISTGLSIVTSNAVAGINYVAGKAVTYNATGATGRRYVMNLSWSLPDSISLSTAIADAYGDNVVIVAAAGDSSSDIGPAPVYPASYSQVIAAGATMRGGNPLPPPPHKWGNSNHGTKVVMAPGANIKTTGIASQVDYQNRDGTSMSAAIVSGVAALVWSRDYLKNNLFDWSKTTVKDRIENTAYLDNPPPEGGKGCLNAHVAVNF